MTKSSGFSKTRSSRCADPGSSSSTSPSGMLVSYSVRSPTTVRARIWLEVS
jgi:hypothetical protein